MKEHFRCDDCGKNFDLKGNVVPDESLVIAYKHDLKYKAAVASTCTEDGVKEYYYCADCGRSYSDETATTLTGDLTVKAEGEESVTGVTIAEVDSHFQFIPGTEKHFDVDTICLAVSNASSLSIRMC